MGCFKRTALKHVYYLGWNRSPAQVGCMRQVLGPGALVRPRGIGRKGRWEGGSGWGVHVKPWLILVNVWQKLLQYCKIISLQLIKKKRVPDHHTCFLGNVHIGQDTTVGIGQGNIGQDTTVGIGQGTMNWFKIGRKYIKAIYCHPAYLTSVRNTSWKVTCWKNLKLEIKLLCEKYE